MTAKDAPGRRGLFPQQCVDEVPDPAVGGGVVKRQEGGSVCGRRVRPTPAGQIRRDGEGIGVGVGYALASSRSGAGSGTGRTTSGSNLLEAQRRMGVSTKRNDP